MIGWGGRSVYPAHLQRHARPASSPTHPPVTQRSCRGLAQPHRRTYVWSVAQQYGGVTAFACALPPSPVALTALTALSHHRKEGLAVLQREPQTGRRIQRREACINAIMRRDAVTPSQSILGDVH
jgi:hypothetical protein